MEHNFNMIRNANVEVEAVPTSKGTAALVTVNGEFQHQFKADSRVSEALQQMPEKELAQRLTGGSFFFVEDELIDFRDKFYHAADGFTHEDDALMSLMKTLGVREVKTHYQRASHRMNNRTQSDKTSLSKIWDTNEFAIPMFKQGGDFKSQLSYLWNPYQKHVRTKFELIRVICTNGMIATTPFINMQIPLVNRWEEHLDIANKQLQNKIHNIMKTRLEEMGTSRASVQDLMTLERHLVNRMGDKHTDQQTRARLGTMLDIVDPYAHCGAYYKAEVFDNKAMAAQLPGHLSTFDAWNVATEMSTHFKPTDKSTDAGLQKLANALVFDHTCAGERVELIGRNIALSPFSSAERAYFAEVEAVA